MRFVIQTLGRYRWWWIAVALSLAGWWWRRQPSRPLSGDALGGAGLVSGHDPLDLKRGSIPGNRDGTPGQSPKD